jgi:hypothetical protein
MGSPMAQLDCICLVAFSIKTIIPLLGRMFLDIVFGMTPTLRILSNLLLATSQLTPTLIDVAKSQKLSPAGALHRRDANGQALAYVA